MRENVRAQLQLHAGPAGEGDADGAGAGGGVVGGVGVLKVVMQGG